MKGEWIEFNDNIYEVISETETDYICREVLYKDFTFKLKYGGLKAINKKEVCL